MSFIIAIYVQEGLVFASDSRITYTTTTIGEDGKETKEKGVHITDTTYKTFLTESNVGIATCGDATVNNKPLAGFIESFVNLHQKDTVETIKDAIIPYFRNIDSQINTCFLVGGYIVQEDGTKVQRLYRITTTSNEIESIDTSNQGAAWDGEYDVISRLVSDLYVKSKDTYARLVYHEILWNYLTLQDAIDFARYAVKTTIDTMRFQRRLKTVGGPIDILVIKPDAAQWINRKELH